MTELKKQQRKGVPLIPLTEANARMIDLGFQPSPSGLDLSYYENIAETEPHLALAGLRIEIDILGRNLATGFGISVQPYESGGKLLKKLYDNGAITDQQMKLTLKILDLANAAADGYKVTTQEARQIITIADVLVEQYISWLSWGFGDGWEPNGQANKQTR